MKLGVCYYPEHWEESSWRVDAERMKAIGIELVRIGEFAWSRLEPRDGLLTFDWLDRAIDTLAEADLKVVLGTPTATPPKWLCDKYENIFQVDEHGQQRGFGSRRHYCYNALSYHQETERIVTLVAERYGQHQAIAAWQTDNEYGCHDTIRCYCPNCQRAFQSWLEDKYGTIDKLNKAWWNVFWSMEYSSFTELELPNLTVTEANPSHVLDYYRFASDAMISYNQLQTTIIRRHSDHPITHNAMLYFDHYDHFKFAQDIDILTWDSYPLGMLEQSSLPEQLKNDFVRCGHPDLISLMHDLYYGVKAKPFWVIEQQPGQVNWAPSNPLPGPGVVRLWTHQAFAHGADVVAYFRWRAAMGAQEQYHAGLNLHNGQPDRASTEAKQVAQELPASVQPSAGTIALAFDYENLWASNNQPQAQGWDYWMLVFSWYRALRALGQDVRVIHPRAALDSFKIVFTPCLFLADDALADHLEAYVAAGGQLVTGLRSGSKTMTNSSHPLAPGPLSTLMGVTVHHSDALRPNLEGQLRYEGQLFTYHTWADLLTPSTADVLASYVTSDYPESTALSRNDVGDGQCYTLGAWTEQAFLKALWRNLLSPLGYNIIDLPESARISQRGTLRYGFNFSAQAQQIADMGTVKSYGVNIQDA